MKRIIVPIVIFYIIGIIIGLYKLSSIALFFFAFFIISIFFIKKTSKPNITIKEILVFFICMIVGIFHIKFYNNYWENTYKNLNVNNIIGEVINLEKENSYQKTLKIRILNNKEKNKSILLKITNKQKLFNEIQIGDKIIFNGEFQEIEIQRNTGGFNYKEYLKSKNIFGILKLKNGRIVENNGISIYTIKNAIIKNIYQKLKKEDADFCLALTIGYKASLNEEIKENFSKINLSHMLAISGLHISYLMIFINLILKPIKSKHKSIILILFLIFFSKITGSVPSVNRVCLSFILSLIAPFLYRKSDTIVTLAVSAIIMLVQNPYVIKDLSFIFSYIGTIGIIIIYPLIKEKLEIFLVNKKIVLLLSNIKIKWLSIIVNKIFNYCLDVSLVTISANILLLPLIIYNFNSISFLFIVSNIIIGPIFIICVILSFFIVLISMLPIKIDKIISNLYSLTVNLVLILSEKISIIDFCNITICTPKLYTMFVIYLIIFIWIYFQKNYYFRDKLIKKVIVLAKKHFTVKEICFLVVIIITIFVSLNIKINHLRIYFVDVGQGDCTVVITPHNKKILIDGGGVKSDEYNVGKEILIPYLLDRGIKKIDFIIISHFDTDHVGGLLTVMEELKVKNIIISKQTEVSDNYEKFKTLVKEKNINVIFVKQGDKLKIENNLYFDIIWPNNSKVINENILNNNSIVCKLNYKNFSMLFTGDIEEIAEKQILQEYKNNVQLLKSTILKVAHHGSKTSSTQEFVEMVTPKIALIGVGKNNKFGHPNDGVIKRLENLRYGNISNR